MRQKTGTKAQRLAYARLCNAYNTAHTAIYAYAPFPNADWQSCYNAAPQEALDAFQKATQQRAIFEIRMIYDEKRAWLDQYQFAWNGLTRYSTHSEIMDLQEESEKCFTD